MTQESPSVQTLINSWSERLKNVEWVECPSCHEEWMKLRPCVYISDSKETVVSHLCVLCAETLVAWDWLTFQMPLPAGLTYTKWMAPRFKQLTATHTIDRPENAYVIVEIGGTEVVARSNGTGQPIRYKLRGQEEVHLADNVYQLRSKIIHTIPY